MYTQKFVLVSTCARAKKKTAFTVKRSICPTCLPCLLRKTYLALIFNFNFKFPGITFCEIKKQKQDLLNRFHCTFDLTSRFPKRPNEKTRKSTAFTRYDVSFAMMIIQVNHLEVACLVQAYYRKRATFTQSILQYRKRSNMNTMGKVHKQVYIIQKVFLIVKC